MGTDSIDSDGYYDSSFGPFSSREINDIGWFRVFREIKFSPEGVVFRSLEDHSLAWDQIDEVENRGEKEKKTITVYLSGGLGLACSFDSFYVYYSEYQECYKAYKKAHVSLKEVDFEKELKSLEEDERNKRCDVIWGKLTTSAELYRLYLRKKDGYVPYQWTITLFNARFLPAAKLFNRFVCALDEDGAWFTAHCDEIEKVAKFWRTCILEQLDHAEGEAYKNWRESNQTVMGLTTVIMQCLRQKAIASQTFDSRVYAGVLMLQQRQGEDQEETFEERAKVLQHLEKPESAQSRKCLVCTDGERDFRKFDQRTKETLVMLASDLKDYNARLAEADRLHFPVGHPVDGQIYVQHPYQPNTYFDLDTFHATMLERKHSELMRVLQALGAKRVECSLENTEGSRKKQASDTQVDGGAKTTHVSVETSVNVQKASSEEENLFLRLRQTMEFNVTEPPHLPDQLLFYHHEEKWQQIAQAALKNQCKRVEVVLEYRQDFAVTEQTAADVKTKVQILMPKVEMHVNTDFSAELKRMTSTTWHYMVEFASPEEIMRLERTTSGTPSAAPSDGQGAPEGSNNATRAEQMIIKRAKRYATNDNKIDAEERSDLEALAKKYGIDDLRLEEIIEEAFES